MRQAIAHIFISPWVLAKINGKHGVTRQDVEDACRDYAKATWIFDEDRGWRLLVLGATSTGGKLRVILYPVDTATGTFNLGTAFY